MLPHIRFSRMIFTLSRPSTPHDREKEGACKAEEGLC